MNESQVTQLIENAHGKIWHIPADLRVPILNRIAVRGIDRIHSALPQSFVDIYMEKIRLGIIQDIVSVFVDWITAHLDDGERPNFDLSNKSIPDNSPRVLLISPTYSRDDASIGIIRIAFFLRGLGIWADWRTATDNRIDEIVATCKSERYDIIGQGTTHFTLPKDLKLIHRLSVVSPTSQFLLGGHGAVLTLEERRKILVDTPISVIIRGFGEFSTARLALLFNKNISAHDLTSRENIPGIYFSTHNGQVIETCTDRYDEQAFRAIHAVFDASLYPVEEGTLRLITSSHCSFSCVFCSSRNFVEQRTVRLQPTDVLHIIRQVRKIHPELKTIEFNDDNFTMNYTNECKSQNGKQWIENLCGHVLPRDIEAITTSCFTRVDTIDSKILQVLYNKLNIRRIGIGLEHVDQNILQQMKKGIDVGQTVKLIRECIRLGIDTNFFIILFSKWESAESLLKLLKISTQLCLEGAQVVYNFGIQPLSGADISNDPTNHYITETYKVNHFHNTYRAKIIPDDPFIGEWFTLMNQERKTYFDLQDNLMNQLIKNTFRNNMFCKSLWLKTVLKYNQNINHSDTLTNLVRFHAMFVFGKQHLEQEALYFQEGVLLTSSAIANYIYNGPTYSPNGVSTIESKVDFLKKNLPNEATGRPSSDLLTELEVIWAGIKMPIPYGFDICRDHYKMWAEHNLQKWHVTLQKVLGEPQYIQQRIAKLLREIRLHLETEDKQCAHIE